MKLVCYQVEPDAQPPEPGRPERDWMTAFMDRHPYRCVPLVVANTTGWDLISPISFSASWNGGSRAEDIRIDPDDDTSKELVSRHVVSHFTEGVLTFHTGLLFRTEPGWDLWVGGSPNFIKDGIQPLVGVVETDWLPFPFTMNWRFTRPGIVTFKKGEPYGFVMPIPHAAIDAFDPAMAKLENDPELHRDYVAWQQSRTSFIDKLRAHDEETKRQGWQRDYFHGRTPEGTAGSEAHINRRRLRAPRPADE